MLAKIGNIIINEQRINTYKKVTLILLFVGLFIFLIFPLLSDRIFITEKQLKNSEFLHNQLTKEFYLKNVRELSNNMENKFEADTLDSVEIHSQRGERNKFIIINSIYDHNSKNNIYPILVLIDHFSNKENFRWLTKDLQFNFILKDDFYLNSKQTLSKLTIENNKIKEGQIIDSVINIDFTSLDFEQNDGLLLKINGANSENIDMDFYKSFYDNLINFFAENKIRTVDYYFSANNKLYLKNILYNIGSMIEGFIPKDKSKNHIQYESDFVYLLENIFQNYLLFNEPININHLLISKGTNSILISGYGKKKRENRNDAVIQKYTEDNTSYQSVKYKKAFDCLLALERVIKNLSKSEIENFRGDYNYILTNSHSFIGIGFYIFIPVLCVLRVFYEMLFKIYTIEYRILSHKGEEGIMASKVVSYSIISFVSQILLFLHVFYIKTYIDFSLISTFYHILIINFIICFSFFRVMKLNKYEEIFLDNMLRFLIALNCFNFFFVNYGFGIIMTIALLPLEVLLVYINERMNRAFLQIFSIGFLMYCVLMDKGIIETMISNYIAHFNNVYPLLTIVLIYFNFRLNLIIRCRLNMNERIKIKTRESDSE